MEAIHTLLYVQDIDKEKDFFEKIGFSVSTAGTSAIVVGAGHTFMLMDEKKALFQQENDTDKKGKGVFFYIQTDVIDTTHDAFTKKGLRPTKPKDFDWGNREFMIKDPAGYKFVFYQQL